MKRRRRSTPPPDTFHPITWPRRVYSRPSELLLFLRRSKRSRGNPICLGLLRSLRTHHIVPRSRLSPQHQILTTHPNRRDKPVQLRPIVLIHRHEAESHPNLRSREPAIGLRTHQPPAHHEQQIHRSSRSQTPQCTRLDIASRLAHILDPPPQQHRTRTTRQHRHLGVPIHRIPLILPPLQRSAAPRSRTVRQHQDTHRDQQYRAEASSQRETENPCPKTEHKQKRTPQGILSKDKSALRGQRPLRGVYTRFASLLPMVGTGCIREPERAPREAQYPSRSDRRPRRAPVRQDTIFSDHTVMISFSFALNSSSIRLISPSVSCCTSSFARFSSSAEISLSFAAFLIWSFPSRRIFRIAVL